MAVYVFGFLISMFFAGIAQLSKFPKLIKNMIFALSMIPLLLIAIFRYNVGTDYVIYSSRQIPQVIYDLPFRSIEPLYVLVIKIGHFLNGNNYFWIFALTHIIIIIFCYLAVITDSTNYFWAQFLFIFTTFFNVSLNMMRQSIAIAIFCFSIQFIYKRKAGYYFFMIFIACLFHTTAIIFFPLYYLNKLDITKFTFKKIGLILVSALILALPVRGTINFIIEKIPKYAVYNGNRYDNLLNNIGSFVNIYTLVSLGLLAFFWLYLKFITNNSVLIEKTNVYLWIVVITAIVSMYQPIIPNANRLIYSVLFSFFIILPYFIDLLPTSRKLTYKCVLVVLFMGIFINSIIINNTGETIPYHSIFELY